MKYHAFISYSYKDKGWGAWVHRALETYRIPSGLEEVAEHYAEEGEVPRKLFPVFRDRDELPTADHITDKVKEALRDSRALVVVCSPRSANSEWVDNEINTFREYHPDRPVLALLVDGDPPDCFPEPLRGNPPLAADVRPGGDGKRDSRLKLVAGLLGTGLGDLRNRDAQRQRRRSLIFGTVATAISLVMTGLAIFAFKARNEAIFQRQLSELQTDAAVAQNLAVTSPKVALGMAVETSERHLELTGDLSDSVISSLVTALEYDRLLMGIDRIGESFDFELSPDGSDALFVVKGGNLRLVNLDRGSLENIGRWEGAKDVTWLPDGSGFFAGNESGEVAIFDRNGGFRVKPWNAHALPAQVSILDDPFRLVSAGLDGEVKFWSPSGEPAGDDGVNVGSFRKLAFDTSAVRFAALPSLDLTTAFSLSDARQPELKNHKFPQQGTLISALAFDRNGKHVATGTIGAQIRLWDSESFGPVRAIPGHEAEVSALDFDPSGRILAAGAMNGKIRVVNLFGELILPPLSDGSEAVRFLRFTPDGQQLVSATESGKLRVWDVRGLQNRPPIEASDAVRSVLLSPDRKKIAAGSLGGEFEIWDLENGERLHYEDLFSEFCGPMVLSKDGGTLIIVSERGRAIEFRDWDGNSAGASLEFPEEIKGINYLRMDRVTGKIYAWGKSNELCVVDPENGNRVDRVNIEGMTGSSTYRPHNAPSEIDDSGLVVIGPSNLDWIGAFNLRTGKKVSERVGKPTYASFSAARFKGILAGGEMSNNRRIGFFRYPTLELEGTYQTGMGREISGLRWIGDDGILAVSNLGGQLRFFSSRGAALGPPIQAHAQAVQGLMTWPETGTLISFGGDGLIRFWTVGSDAWLRLARERFERTRK